jgi:hypothetical protein
MEVKRTDFRASSVSNSVEETAHEFQLGEAIGMAAARSNFNNKQLCAFMNLDPGTWSKQLQGDGHISLTRLLKCPDAFVTELLGLIAAHYGLGVVGGNGVSQSIARCLLAMADVIARLELTTEQRRVG